MLTLSNDLSFIYNDKFVTHRQAYYPEENDLEKPCFNLSSYGNEKMFNYLRRTYQGQNNN